MFLVKLWSCFSPILSGALTILALTLVLRNQYIYKNCEDLIRKSLGLNTMDLHTYVNRTKLESNLNSFLNKSRPSLGSYMVVYGPTGSGKTTLITKVMQERPHSIFVRICEEDTVEALQRKMIKMYAERGGVAGGSIEDFKLQLKNNTVVSKITTIIVFEVEWSANVNKAGQVVKIVRSMCHKFCLLARIIVVVADTSTIVHLRRDNSRATFLVVNEFSQEEAVTLLTKLDESISEVKAAHIYDQVGGNPGMLKHALGECQRLGEETAHNRHFETIRSQLAELIVNPLLKHLMIALLKSGGAVSSKRLFPEELRISALVVALIGELEGGDLIFYNLEDMKYVVSSAAVLRAMRAELEVSTYFF